MAAAAELQMCAGHVATKPLLAPHPWHWRAGSPFSPPPLLCPLALPGFGTRPWWGVLGQQQCRQEGLLQDCGLTAGRGLWVLEGSGVQEVSVCLSVCPRRHGQLGHGTLESEPQPRLLEALAGVAMRAVAAGGWHSASVSGEGPCGAFGMAIGSALPGQDQDPLLRLSPIPREHGAWGCGCWCTRLLPPVGVQG